jgi:PAS domain S-box-containing protein
MLHPNYKAANETPRRIAAKTRRTRKKKPSASDTEITSVVEKPPIYGAELELQQSPAQLEDSETKYFRYFDLAPVGMIRLNDQGLILEANILGAKMLGFERNRLHSGKIALAAHLAHNSQRAFHAHLKKALASSKMESCELSLRSPSGIETFVRMQSIVSRGADNAADLFVALTDLTEHQQFEEILAQQKETAVADTLAKDQFLAMLSHELRTPLTPVALLVEELQQSPALSEQHRELLTVMRRNLQLETLLIDDLLDLTRISKGKLELNREITDARTCLSGAIEVCRHDLEAKLLEFKVYVNAPYCVVDADCSRLQQIIWNLLHNAIKFTSTGGAISVRLFNDSPQRLTLEVTDTGVGMELMSMLRIFNPFAQGERPQRRRFGGLGLGLAISKSLVEAHEGSLTAFSAGLGKGSTFRLELPTVGVTELPATTGRQETSVSKRQTELNILIVEDHEDTRHTLQRMLVRQGYHVEATWDATSAEALCAQEKFDLLLCDISLPDRSGLELMKEMKERHGLEGIAMSGFGMESDIAMSAAAGFSEHLIKPIDLQKLEAAIQRIALQAGHST